MGLRFRKSFKVAPGVKVNLNKKSTSVTFGGKGAHYTVNSKGKKTKSVGVPGSGLYYTKTSGGSSRKKSTSSSASSSKNSKKNGGCLFPVLIASIVLLLITLLMPSDNSLSSIELAADTGTEYNIGQSASITIKTDPENYDIPENAYKSSGGTINVLDGQINFSSDSSGVFDVWIEDGDVKSNTLSFTVIDKSAAESAEQNSAEPTTEATPEPQEQDQQPQEQLVWIPQSGSKYHIDPSCSGMENPTEITLSEAQSMGYEACKRCY